MLVLNRFFSAETGNLINTFSGHSEYVSNVCFSSNRQKIVSGSFDKSIKIWDTTTGNLINDFRDIYINRSSISNIKYTPLAEKIKKLLNQSSN